MKNQQMIDYERDEADWLDEIAHEAHDAAIEQPLRSNRNPIDRLADIRKEISRLRDEATQIRDGIIDGSISRHGDEWTAAVMHQCVRRISIAEAELALPPDVFDRLVRTSPRTLVRLTKRGAFRRPSRHRTTNNIADLLS